MIRHSEVTILTTNLPKRVASLHEPMLDKTSLMTNRMLAV